MIVSGDKDFEYYPTPNTTDAILRKYQTEIQDFAYVSYKLESYQKQITDDPKVSLHDLSRMHSSG